MIKKCSHKNEFSLEDVCINKVDRCNKYTHAQGIYVKSIYRLLKLSIQNGNMRYMYTFIKRILLI